MSKPTVFLMLGYPGAGKTTASTIIEHITGATHLWADKERQKLFRTPTYSKKENAQLYSHLNEKTELLLRRGMSVIYDTAFNLLVDRQKLTNIAHKFGANSVVVWVQAPKIIAKKRALNAHEHQHTRVLGSMDTTRFERLSSKLEQPMDNENVLELDGTALNEQYIRHKLEKYI